MKKILIGAALALGLGLASVGCSPHHTHHPTTVHKNVNDVPGYVAPVIPPPAVAPPEEEEAVPPAEAPEEIPEVVEDP